MWDHNYIGIFLSQRKLGVDLQHICSKMDTLLDFLAREGSVHESTSGFKVKPERKQNKEVNIKQWLLQVQQYTIYICDIL